MKIEKDKQRHFYGGIIIGCVFQIAAMYLMPAQPVTATAIVFAAVVSISYGFELFSKFTGKGHYEMLDAIAAIVGGLVGMVLGAFLIKLLAF
ncbi:MAG: hypothetical protein V4676_10275 [Bacteroidota bacterium]